MLALHERWVTPACGRKRYKQGHTDHPAHNSTNYPALNNDINLQGGKLTRERSQTISKSKEKLDGIYYQSIVDPWNYWAKTLNYNIKVKSAHCQDLSSG